MDDGIEHIEELVGNLNIAENTSQYRGGEGSHSIKDCLDSIHATIHTLTRTTNAINSQAYSIKRLTDNAKSSNRISGAEVHTLHEDINKLANVTRKLHLSIDILHESTERSVIKRLTSCGYQSQSVIGELLSHFDETIMTIVREVLDHTSDHEILWKVAEECYKQTAEPFGKLAVDQAYAAAFQKKADRISDARSKDQQSWSAFWITVLSNTPCGPTLFYPPASLYMQTSCLDDVPRYLFRTFDEASLGVNDESVIASIASIHGPLEGSRTDLLTQEKPIATKLLHDHLTNTCIDDEVDNNLMSWTSSFLFAVQYAIWRVRKGHGNSSQIKICTVDTRKFPQGQFMQDLWLIRAYNGPAKDIGDETKYFFDFRLGHEDYYNGEYLSQGRLNHAGRSCVMSLKNLEDNGLFQIYPEFANPQGGEKWTNRVKELRRNWSPEKATTDKEIELALGLACECFTAFERCEIAAVLLTLKNRKKPRPNSVGISHKQPPNWAVKPAEVRRFWSAAETLDSHGQNSKTWPNNVPSQSQKMLRAIFC